MSEFGEVIDQSFGVPKQQARMNAVASVDDDPDKAARAFELGEATDTPPAVVYGDVEGFERQHKARLVSEIISGNPHLQEYVNSHPLNAKISNDDFGNLDSFSEALKKLYPSAAGRVFNAPTSIVAKAGEGFREGFGDTEDVGEWANRDPNDAYYSQQYPILYTVAKTVAQVAGVPIELMGKTFSGVLGAIDKGGTEALSRFGMDEDNAHRMMRDVTAAAEQYMFGTLGVHRPQVHLTTADIQKIHVPLKLAEPYIRSGEELPSGLHPVIDEIKAIEAKLDMKGLDEAMKEAQGSLTKERNPEVFAGFARQHTDSDISVSADAIRKLYGDKIPEADDGILGWVPRLQEQLEIAEGTGGRVKIPLADWLSKADPEIHKELHDFISVRPQGVTLEELKNKAEVKEAVDTTPVSAVRQSAALEPLAEREQEQKLTVQKGEVSAEGTHQFKFLDEKGKEVGDLRLAEENGGKRLYIDWIAAKTKFGTPNSFGPSVMRDIFRQLHEQYPNAETIAGYRVSGARAKASSTGHVEIPLKALLEEGDVKAFQDLQGIVEGSWHDYGQTRAYIKEPDQYSAAEKFVADKVENELQRILPSLVDVAGAHKVEVEGRKVRGVYLRFAEDQPLILYSLHGNDPSFTGRHEAIHHLRQYQFFSRDEWATLRATAIKEDWLEKFNIRNRYPNIGLGGQLEEAVADGFADWMRRRDMSHPAAGIFEKLRELLTKIKTAVKDAWNDFKGEKPDFDRIFRQVESGEIGERESQGPLNPSAFNPKAQRESKPLTIKDAVPSAEPEPGKVRLWRGASFAGQGTGKKFVTTNRKQAEMYITPNLAYSEKAGSYLQYVDIDANDPRVKIPEGHSSLAFEADPDIADRLQPFWKEKDLGSLSQEEPELPGMTRMEDRDIFQKANATGMTVDQYKRYMALIDKRNAEDAEFQLAQAKKAETRRQTKEWKGNERRIKAEVGKEVEARPDIAALRSLVSKGDDELGKVRLNSERLTEEEKAGLPKGSFGPRGIDPDDLAGFFGYLSGKDMLAKIMELQEARQGLPLRDFTDRLVKRETDLRMEAQYGNLQDNILSEAKDHVISDTQLDLLHEETLALAAKGDSELPITRQEMQGWAKGKFDQMPVGSVSKDAFLADAGRAGRAAEVALLKGDPAEGFRQRQRQYLAMLFANEAKKLEKTRGQFDRIAKQYRKREVEGVPAEYSNFVHDILERVGESPLGREDIDTEIGAGSYKDLKSFVEGKQAEARLMPVANFLYDEPFRKEVDKMTAEEFTAVTESLKTITHNGRMEGKIYKAGELEDFNETMEKMVEQIQTLKEKVLSQPDMPGGALKELGQAYFAASMQLETLFNRIDRNNPRGIMNQVLVRQYTTAVNELAAVEKVFGAKLADLIPIKDINLKVSNQFFRRPLPEGKFGDLLSLSRRNVLAMVQNTGNPGNFEGLLKGYGIDPKQSDAVMSWLFKNTTKEDWDRAKEIGEVFKSGKELSDKMYRNVSGVAPANIETWTVHTPWGDYEGWYHPKVYDRDLPQRSKKLKGPDFVDAPYFERTTPSAGYTKSRTGYIGPYELNLEALPFKLSEVLYDATMRPTLIQLSKIFKDDRFRDAMTKHYGQHYTDLLDPFLRDLSGMRDYQSEAQNTGIQAIQFIRQNMISHLVGLNPSTLAKHTLTSMVNSITEVGLKNYLEEFTQLVARNPETGESNWRFAMNKSEELQRRHRNMLETVRGGHETSLGRFATEDSLGSSFTDRPLTEGFKLASNVVKGKYLSFRESLMYVESAPLAFFDQLFASATFNAAYKNAMKQGLGEGQAVFEGDRAVRRSHGSTAITNRPEFMRAHPLVQTLGTFYGFFNHILQRQYEMAWATKEALTKGGYYVGHDGEVSGGKLGAPNVLEFEKNKEGTYDYKTSDQYKRGLKAMPVIAAMVSSYFIAPALIEELVQPLHKDRNESEFWHWSKVMMRGLSASWLYGRDFVHGAIEGGDITAGLFGTAARYTMSAVKDLEKYPALKTLEGQQRFLRDANNLVGALTGLTNSSIPRMTVFGYNVATGRERPKTGREYWRGITQGTSKERTH